MKGEAVGSNLDQMLLSSCVEVDFFSWKTGAGCGNDVYVEVTVSGFAPFYGPSLFPFVRGLSDILS